MYLNQRTITKKLGINKKIFWRIIKEAKKNYKCRWHLSKQSRLTNEWLFNTDIILKILKDESLNNQRLPVELDIETKARFDYEVDK